MELLASFLRLPQHSNRKAILGTHRHPACSLLCASRNFTASRPATRPSVCEFYADFWADSRSSVKLLGAKFRARPKFVHNLLHWTGEQSCSTTTQVQQTVMVSFLYAHAEFFHHRCQMQDQNFLQSFRLVCGVMFFILAHIAWSVLDVEEHSLARRSKHKTRRSCILMGCCRERREKPERAW